MRCVDFFLRFEDFSDIIERCCNYCGSPPNRKFKDILYNGLDRIDNNKGYEINNIAPCCWACNSAKMNLTRFEFLNRIKKCYMHLNKMGKL